MAPDYGRSLRRRIKPPEPPTPRPAPGDKRLKLSAGDKRSPTAVITVLEVASTYVTIERTDGRRARVPMSRITNPQFYRLPPEETPDVDADPA